MVDRMADEDKHETYRKCACPPITEVFRLNVKYVCGSKSYRKCCTILPLGSPESYNYIGVDVISRRGAEMSEHRVYGGLKVAR